MSAEIPQADPSIEEQLVAYLDGELDATGRRRIEDLLATDTSVRETLQKLDRTWELLDQLSTPSLGEDFTRTTLEMVTVAAADDVAQDRTRAVRRHTLRWTMVGGSLLVAGLIGFGTVAYLRPDPVGQANRQLIEDLPVLQRLDEYRLVDDFEFLRTLSQEDLFTEDEVAER